MKRILLYTQNHQPGGGNRYFTDFINAVPPHIEVVVACNKGGLFANDLARITRPYTLDELPVGSFVDTQKRCNNTLMRFVNRVLNRMPVTKYFWSRRYRNANRALFADYLSTRSFDGVWAFNGGYPAALSCFDLLYIAHQKGSHTTMSVVSMPQAKGVLDRLYQGDLGSVNRFVVNCAAIQGAMATTRGIDSKTIDVLYNCTHLPEQINDPSRFLSGKSLRFGFVGRVEYLKGAQLLIEAFADLAFSIDQAELHLYGKPMLDQATQDIVAAQKNIVLHGPFDSADRDVYPNIDVLILPSFWEGFPYVVIEAMSFGIPVIATDVGGVGEVVRTSETGLLIAPRSKVELERAIRTTYEHREGLTRLGANARTAIEQRFSFDVFAQNVERVV